MLIHLDPDTSLPTQKYDAPFKLDVLKKWDLWKNAQDCGFGDFLLGTYPALTIEEAAERSRRKKERKEANDGDDYEESDEEDDGDSDEDYIYIFVLLN